MFLFVDLYGPLAAWGDVAVGETRPAYTRPSRSAVLGLVGAALGVRRTDEEGQRALREGYGFGVRVDAQGRLLLDYHTAQVPTGVRARGLPTRRDELGEGGLNTTLSTRSYRTDALATVCLWGRDYPRWTLADMATALERPAFPLYLGRRSCPLALPLAPSVVEADTVVHAFRIHDEQRNPRLAQVREVLVVDEPRELFLDADAPGVPEGAPRTARRDDPLHRGRWTFQERPELIVALDS